MTLISRGDPYPERFREEQQDTFRRDPLVRMLVEEIGLTAPGMNMDVLRELKRLRDAGWEMDKEDVLWVIESSGQRFDERVEKERQADENRLRRSVVYYMRIGNRVKIGTTRNLPKRVATLCPEEVMVTEPGDAWVERGRHAKFAELRVHGEWFRLEEPLISHIEDLKRRAEDHAA